MRHIFILVPLFLSLVSSATANDYFISGTPETDRAVTKRITSKDGGELVARGSDGTEYRLTIPKLGLLFDETITLTPMKGVSGIDGVSEYVAFDIKPHQPSLFRPAVMMIKPGPNTFKGKDLRKVLVFKTDGDATFSKASVAFPTKQGLGMNLFHFSGGGALPNWAMVIEMWGAAESNGGFWKSRTQQQLEAAEKEAGFTVGQAYEAGLEWRSAIVQKIKAGEIPESVGQRLLSDANAMIEKMWEYWKGRSVPRSWEELEAEAEKEKLDNIAKGMSEKDAAATKAVEIAEKLAKHGRAAELDTFAEQLRKVFENERHRQLLGQEPGSPQLNRIMQLIEDFVVQWANSCQDQTFDANTVVSINRQLQLIGIESPELENRARTAMEKLHRCRPKLTLDQAIARCRTTGDFQTLMHVYQHSVLALSSSGVATDLGARAAQPDVKHDALKSKTLAALASCARYQLKFKINYDWHRNEGSVPFWKSTASWDGDASASFKPGQSDANSDSVVSGKVEGPILTSRYSNCGCVVTKKGGADETCEPEPICPSQNPFSVKPGLKINELRFNAGELVYLKFELQGVGHERRVKHTFINRSTGKREHFFGKDTTKMLSACPLEIYVTPSSPTKTATASFRGRCGPEKTPIGVYISNFEIELKQFTGR